MDRTPKSSVKTVGIQPRNIYGLRDEILGNIHYNLNQEVIYPVEGVLAFHNYVTNKQRYLRLPEDITPVIISISPHRKLLAILEISDKLGTNISIYDLISMKKRRNLQLPNGSKDREIAKIEFTHDSKSIVVLTKAPNELLFMLMMDKSITVIEGRAANSNNYGVVDCIACNPQDTAMVAVCGEYALKLMSKSEKTFAINAIIKSSTRFTSFAWLSMEVLVVGTSEGELHIIETGENKSRYVANEVLMIDLLVEQEQPPLTLDAAAKPVTGLLDSRIVCMTSFTKGLAYAQFNSVYVFEKVSKFIYERKTILRIPIGIYKESSYQITNLAIDPKQETVIVTTKHAQIYVGVLIVPETLKTKYLEFQTLGELIHIGEIIDISVCSWRPIIMTASKDQTIRIWNYETEKVELVKKYQVEVTVVELNPTGLLAAIGFPDQLRIVQIFMDDLRIVKTYNFPRCKDVRYSTNGHLMAAAYDTTIAVTSVFSLDVVIVLKGHNGNVLSVAWTKDDKHLISGGDEGAIYQWDIENGNRINEIVEKGIEYRSICVTKSEPPSIYAATNISVMREFQVSEITREVSIPSKVKTSPLTGICLARSDLIMFVANELGQLFNVQLPFLDAGGGTCTSFRFFASPIVKLCFSFDGTMLITASKRGTLAIWALENITGKVAPHDQDLLKSQEVLIPRNILQEKNEQITNLEVRLKQQAAEFLYQISQNEIFDSQQMADIHKGYCQALEELKNRNNELEQRHIEEMNQVTFQIDDIKADHKRQMDNLSTQYSERMLMEYQKFTSLRENMIEIRDSYEDKLRKSAGCLQDTVEALESDFKKQLDERKELIRELMKEMQDKKIEFIEYCRQVEVENDRNMVETQLQYENKLIVEKEESKLWRGNAGVLQKKYDTLTKERENLLEEVETLKDEHNKSQKTISKLVQNIEDLQKDISERDYAISSKEKRIQELLHKNQELDKYKQVLAHKITELKAQIEPREFQINDKRKHISEMEQELNGLNQNNFQLELQLKELKDKYLSNTAELKIERNRSRTAREFITSICSSIYHVAGKINSQEQLKHGVRNLFQKYANDNELRRYISQDAEVKAEFHRQRAQIERIMEKYKSKTTNKSHDGKSDKLVKQNIILMNEIDKLRHQNAILLKSIPQSKLKNK